MTPPALLWFREDLRLADNPALHAAAASKQPVLAIFVLDECAGGPRARGGAARWWLNGSLESLAASLAAKGGALTLFRGDAGALVPALAQAAGASRAFWNRRYDGPGRDQDAAIEAALTKAGCTVEAFNGKLLFEPAEMRTKSDTPFRVFGPFKRALFARGDPPSPLPAPRRLQPASVPSGGPQPVSLKALDLLPTKPDWAGGLRETWTPGEPTAAKQLRVFLKTAPDTYARGRDLPAQDASSRLSPHVAAGELSSRQLWHAARHALEADGAARAGIEKYLSELAWRDFAYHLLFHHPDLASKHFNARFDRFPWRKGTAAHLRAWRTGTTGYPIVDAGMRQLWHTGWMHNRVRLIAASFLVKHLLIDWRVGEDWFDDTLCDIDPANNAMNWQWIAGSGPDAAPYFRVFNPVLQGEKFDGDGDYVKRWIPALRAMPSRFVHRPWDAPADVLETAGVHLGRDYPRPIVDHAAARAAALAAFAAMRG